MADCQSGFPQPSEFSISAFSGHLEVTSRVNQMTGNPLIIFKLSQCCKICPYKSRMFSHISADRDSEGMKRKKGHKESWVGNERKRSRSKKRN